MRVFRQRQIEVTQINHAKDPVDSYIQSAFWIDTGEELNDDELDALQTQRPDIAHDAWYENAIDRADRMRDEAKEMRGC